MASIIKILAATAIITLGASTAHAADDQKLEFKYNASAPAETTYHNLQEQVKRICKKELGVFYAHGQRGCMADYMEEILSNIGSPTLWSYYEKRDGSDQEEILLAQENTQKQTAKSAAEQDR